jgi:hypothetical protein
MRFRNTIILTYVICSAFLLSLPRLVEDRHEVYTVKYWSHNHVYFTTDVCIAHKTWARQDGTEFPIPESLLTRMYYKGTNIKVWKDDTRNND